MVRPTLRPSACVACHQGMLGLADVQRRVAQFVAAGLPILVTTACLLVDKARLLPGSSFVVSAVTQHIPRLIARSKKKERFRDTPLVSVRP